MKRWALRIGIGLVVLIVLAAIAAQIVLWSDLPRAQAEQRLRAETGLDISIDDLGLAWSGRSKAENVKVGLPLEGQPFLTIPTLELDHTGLMWLVFGSGFEVDHVRLINPAVVVRQGADGQWNVEHAQQILAARLQGGPDETGGDGRVDLPRFGIRNGTAIIAPLDRGPVRLTDVSVQAEPEGDLIYKFQAQAPGLGEVVGELATVEPHMHVAAFSLTPSAAFWNELELEALAGTRAQGRWSGQLTGTGLTGRLAMVSARVGDVASATGQVNVSVVTEGPLQVHVEPRGLLVETGALPEPARVLGGTLVYREEGLVAERLRVAAMDGRVLVDGNLDLNDLTGTTSVAWEAVRFPVGFEHEGSAQLQLDRTGPTRRHLRAELTTRGESPLGPWRGNMDLAAVGPRWSQLQANLLVREFRMEANNRTYVFDGMRAAFDVDAPVVDLTSVRLVDATGGRLDGSGQFNWDSRQWSAAVRAAELALPGVEPRLTAAVVQVAGDDERLRVDQADVQAAGVVVEGAGAYVYRDPKPLRMQVTLREAPIRMGGGDEPLVRAENLAGELTVAGTVSPLRLEAEGDLLASDLAVRRETLGDVRLQVVGEVNRQTAALGAKAVEWLGGQWQVGVVYDRAAERMRLDADAKDLDLRLVDQLLAQPLGVEIGRADVTLRAEDLEQDLTQARMTARVALRDVQRGPLKVTAAEGRLTVEEGWLRLRDVTARHGEGALRGSGAVELLDPDHIELQAELNQWPLDFLEERLLAQVSGQAGFTIDISERMGTGAGDLRVHLAGPETDVGTFTSNWALENSQLALTELEGQLLGGSVSGHADVNLREPLTELTAELHWQDLALRQIEPLLAETAQISGSTSGSVVVEQMTGQRAIGPTRITATFDATDVVYRELPVGEGRMVLFLDPPRFVLHRVNFDVAGGHLSLWGRVTPREQERFVYAHAAARNLDLRQISSALAPEDEPVLGKLGGELTVSTAVGQWEDAFGRGSMTLRDSDLATIPLFSELYNLVNLSITRREPEGEGEAHFRVEAGEIVFDRFRYDNRGFHVRLFGRVLDIWQGLDSPITGYAIPSLQPLPDVELLNVVTGALAAFQSEFLPQRIRGTLNEPRLTPAPLRGFRSALGQILGAGGGEDDEEEEGQE